jgi:hypothetical protein
VGAWAESFVHAQHDCFVVGSIARPCPTISSVAASSTLLVACACSLPDVSLRQDVVREMAVGIDMAWLCLPRPRSRSRRSILQEEHLPLAPEMSATSASNHAAKLDPPRTSGVLSPVPASTSPQASLPDPPVEREAGASVGREGDHGGDLW